jgi:hypothetical protein
VINLKRKEMYLISPNDFRRKLREYVAQKGKCTSQTIVESDTEKTTFGILLPFSFCADVIKTIGLDSWSATTKMRENIQRTNLKIESK